jgi:hypothetical protein
MTAAPGTVFTCTYSAITGKFTISRIDGGTFGWVHAPVTATSPGTGTVHIAAPFRELGLTEVTTATSLTVYEAPNVANLLGDDYAVMCIEQCGQMMGTEGIPDAFAKIIWASPSRTASYNSFIGGVTEFPAARTKMDLLSIKFMRPNGTLYEFNGVEHSFSLRFTCDVA